MNDLLNIDNPYFEQKASEIHPAELQLNKKRILHECSCFIEFIKRIGEKR